jgi:hypothetical protein
MSMLCPLGDATPYFQIADRAEPRTSRAMPAGVGSCLPLSHWADAAPARSRLEALTLLAEQAPSKDGDLLGVLLASTFPRSGRGCEVLQPLWAEEAMHRAFSLARLAQYRGGRGEVAGWASVAASLMSAIASDLAIRFRELETGGERDMRPCSGVLRDVVTGLGALFGGPANITLRTKIEDISLPAYKRRALVLAAAELVSNALLHAFRGCRTGRIEVDLTATGPGTACLRVADNGIGFTDLPPNLDCGVASGLAGLLEADLAYERSPGWTIAEIAFPVPQEWAGQ